MRYSVWHRSLVSALIPSISSLTISSCGLHRLALEFARKEDDIIMIHHLVWNGFDEAYPLAMVAIRQRGHCHCDDAHGNLRKRQINRFRGEHRFPWLRWNIPRLVLVKRTGGAGGLSSSLDISDSTSDPCVNYDWPINYFYLQSNEKSFQLWLCVTNGNASSFSLNIIRNYFARDHFHFDEWGLRMRMPEQCARESHIISSFYFSL